MELRDWIAIVALVISLVSLGLSVSNFRFSRRVKVLELNAVINAKAVELLVRLMSLSAALQELRTDAELAGESALAADVPADIAAELVEDMRQLYENFSKLPSSNVVQAHETVFNAMHKLSEVASELDRRAARTKVRLDQLAALSRHPVADRA